MSFNLREFAHTNRVFLIWSAFAALIYLMKEMFGLVFLTFIMSFIVHGLSRALYRFTKQRRRFLVVVIYLLFLLAILFFFLKAVPIIMEEAKNFTKQLPVTQKLIDDYFTGLAESNPGLAPIVERIHEALTFESLMSQGWRLGKVTLERAWHYFSWFFIAILFSFLIMLDLSELIVKVRGLRYSKVSVIYDETVSSVIKFSLVVGENFRAQILISLINTVLTFIGLQIIGTGTVSLLTITVFCCGLIPVLGVLLSSIPIFLVALNTGGLKMVGAVAVLIVFVHALEAYVLNPRIVSAVMRINPVMTLMILYIAHSLMGMWGMFLGVPISVYFYRMITVNREKVDIQNSFGDQSER